MDGVGGEVSHKIKAAIKAKLIELGAYVDDELPDYIMVMVANKRTRSQMDDDLSLFLNNNTKVFTSWLHSVLKKLQEVTIAAADKKEPEENVKKRKRSLSRDSQSKKSKEKDPKAKKKHGKKHKDKKIKKERHKNKQKEAKQVVKFKSNGKRREVPTDSDWSDTVPEKQKKVQDDMDLNKEVGKAILGTMKEKHKDLDKKDAVDKVESLDVLDNDNSNKRPDSLEQPEKEVERPNQTNINTEHEVGGSSLVLEAARGQNSSANMESTSAANIAAPFASSSTAPETTVLAPTLELLREHDKLTSQQVEKCTIEQRPASHLDSEESLDPEIIRQHLLQSRAKRKLEEKKRSSVSPEVVILEEKTTEKSPVGKPIEEVKKSFKSEDDAKIRVSVSPYSSDRLSISAHSSHSSSPIPSKTQQKKMLTSCIVAPPEPLEPGVASTVTVKPREFGPKEKQANKKLILKAVAAAERSVAIPARKTNLADDKPKALFTKDLRGKRYENMAVTVTNPTNRRDDHHVSEEVGSRSAPLRKALLEGEEEHFISSKTSGKDRNVLYIQTWLEGVEEAVQNDGLIKPDEIEGRVSEDEEEIEGGVNKAEERIKATQDGAQIVVVVDGVTSKRQTTVKESASSKVPKEINRISDRFAKISQPAEQHEYKAKFKEFEKARTERKINRDGAGESKNKRLIAELSLKFGQVDRKFDQVDREPVGRRKNSVEEERSSRRERKTSRPSGESNIDSSHGKSSERCRFWPDCVRNSACEFHHPSSICKLLPNCKFKEKCLNIHPICRKDADCRLRDCPYEHSRRRKSDSRDAQKKVLCKYDRSCKKSSCPFLHSKKTLPCRYGSRCSDRECPYSHRRVSPAC